MKEYTSNVDLLVEETIYVEGAYVDHPMDRGGPTKYGITLDTLKQYHFEVENYISDSDNLLVHLKALTKEKAIKIYFWLFRKHGAMYIKEKEMQRLLFDSCVHHGPRAKKWLQKIIHVKQDGIIGPITIAAYEESRGTYNKFLSKRFNFIAQIVERDHTQAVFLEGWINRVVGFIR